MQEESDLSHDTPYSEVPDGETLPLEPSPVVEPIAEPLTGNGDSLEEDSQLPPSPAEEIAEPEPEPEAEAEPEPEAVEAVETAEPVVVTPEPEPEPATPMPPAAARVPWWPFIILAVLWLSLSGAAAYVLTRASGVPAYQQEWYFAIVLAGVVLTLLGPLVAIVTWAVVRKEAAAHERGALFMRSILRASAITLVGVLAWWGTLVVVDALRLGLIRF